MVEWVAYMDESGNRTGSKADETDVFVLSCITGSPAALYDLANTIRGFKRGLAPQLAPDNWELKGKNIMRGPNFRGGKSPLRTRDVSKKLAMLQCVVAIVNELDIAVFSIIVRSKAMRQKHGRDSITKYATTLMLERLELFSRLHNLDTIHLVSDDVKNVDKEIISNTVINSSQGNNSISKMRTHHITSIEYVDSKSSVLVQTADILSYVVKRHHGGDEDIRGAFDELEMVMQKNAKAGLDGCMII